MNFLIFITKIENFNYFKFVAIIIFIFKEKNTFKYINDNNKKKILIY
jgi:hypothetical protein